MNSALAMTIGEMGERKIKRQQRFGGGRSFLI